MGICAYIINAFKDGAIKKADALRWLMKSDSHLSIYDAKRLLGVA
jgi:hypothetical protein